MDAELEFAIQPNTLGNQLVEQVLHISPVNPNKLKRLLILHHDKKESNKKINI